MSNQYKKPTNQQGITFIGLLLWGFLLGTVGMFGLKTMPIYTEYFGVVESLKSLAASPGTGSQPKSEIRRDLQKKFDVNNVESINAKNVKLQKLAGGTTVTADYEVRTPLFWDFDLVAKLKKTVQLRP